MLIGLELWSLQKGLSIVGRDAGVACGGGQLIVKYVHFGFCQGVGASS